jgi:ribosomal-protein-alanine N-acetyltransferase
MGGVALRRAVTPDIDGWLAAVEAVSNPSPWTRHQLFAEVDSPWSEFWVAEVDGTPMGFVLVHVPVEETEILEIAVDERVRRRGVGRALMLHAMQRARARGGTALLLEVRVSNEPARRLYESLGFVANGIRPRYYRDNHEDALLMRLDLSDSP